MKKPFGHYPNQVTGSHRKVGESVSMSKGGAIFLSVKGLYLRFTLSLRNVEEILAAWGIVISYEAVRQWCLIFGQQYANKIRHCYKNRDDTWFLVEVFITINGVLHYLWRVIDQDGDVLDILV